MSKSIFFIFRKISIALLSVFVVITITFFLMRAVPGNVYTNERVINVTVSKNIQEKYHLNSPISTQYFFWLKDVSTFNFGTSMFSDGRSVNQIIKTHAPISLVIGVVTFLLSFFTGVYLGVYLSVIKKTKYSKIISTIVVLGMTLPNFVIAALLQYYFSVKMGLFPVLSSFSFIGLVLPIVALSIYPTAYITRTIYYTMIDILKKEYITAARARGIPENRIIFIHALKNAILPLFAYLGPFLASVLIGSFAIETIFNIPGLGRYYISSISNRDYTVIMGLTAFFSLLLVSINLVVDVINTFLDPRIEE